MNRVEIVCIVLALIFLVAALWFVFEQVLQYEQCTDSMEDVGWCIQEAFRDSDQPGLTR